MARFPRTFPARRAPRRLTWRSVIVSFFTLLGRLVADKTAGRGTTARKPTRTRR